MISLQAPLWLLLLGLIPLIRWLHRFRQQATSIPSTTLFLWRTFQQNSTIDGAAGRPDARWLLRALIATLIILCLSKPSLQHDGGPSIEVWLDDSLSMFTIEDGQTRIRTGMQQLQLYLAKTQASRIRIHSLGNPASQLVLETGNTSRWPSRLAEWTSQPLGEPLPPPPATLSPFSSHILLSDGADSALNSWAQDAPLHHLIQTGNAQHNLALTRLSLRRPLNASGKLSAHINGMVRIDNPGKAAQQTRLILQLDERIVDTQLLDIPPADKVVTSFTIAATARGRFQARIESAHDSLPLDDELGLYLDQLNPALQYQLQGDCDLPVVAALDAHPALIRVTGQPQVMIDCSGQADESSQPTLRLHPAHSILHTSESGHWHHDITPNSLQLAAGLAYSDSAPPLSSRASPILSADGRMLILQQQQSAQTIDSYLDTSDTAFARQPEYPLLLLGLISRLSGSSLGADPLTASINRIASRIAPAALSITPAPPAETRPAQTSLTGMLLITALLLLVVDAALAFGLVRGPRMQRG
jgi:hypothetical protein